MTPLSVAILALSLSVRLLLRTLPLLPRRSSGLIAEPAAHLRRVALQALDALGLLRCNIGLDGLGILLTVAFEHSLGCGFKLRGLAFEVRARAALGLARITGQFHSIDREHLAPDQA